MPAEPITRDTTYAERATWGECPVCKAQHGEPCNPDIGFSVGLTSAGLPPRDGAHLGRLQHAPRRIELRPVL